MGTDNPSNDVEDEFKLNESLGSWRIMFDDIRKQSLQHDFTTLDAVKNKNKNLNRYRDVSPFDHSRIILKRGRCDYINANLVEVEKAGRKYILTQGPLQQTTGHFWLMIWEQKSRAIIMLNRLIEKDQEKCHQYWPRSTNRGEDTIILTDVGLEITYVSEVEASYYTTRTLRLKDLESGEKRDILQFHYTTWPDFGVPQSPKAFLRFLSAVRRSGVLEAEGPCIVHCSAGIGRSGTFCLVDSCLVLIKKYGSSSVNIKEMLLEMRRYRMGLIQTPDQLRFSYLAIIEGIKKDWDTVNDNEVIEDENNGNFANESSDSDDDDEPPPLPPPRGESLASRTPPLSTEDATSRPFGPLPEEPSSPGSSPSSGSDSINDKYQQTEARIAKKLEDMKKKQEAAEKWRKVKRKHSDTEADDEDAQPMAKKK